MTKNDYLSKAKELLKVQSEAIAHCGDHLGDDFIAAIELIKGCIGSKNKLVFIGIGKSHFVAAKVSASFMSTGVSSIFVHAAEAFHGDLGMIHPGDLCFVFSKSGSTAEILGLIPFLKKKNKIVAITGNSQSPLARHSDICLNASVQREACPINMLPTTSTTVSLAIGDALVSVFAEEQGFNKEVFAHYHPGGSIGKRLNQHVQDVLLEPQLCATGPKEMSLHEISQMMTQFPTGAFCAVDNENHFKGLVTDGDLRRAFANGMPPNTPCSEILNENPIPLSPDTKIDDAICILEQRERPINCAPVIDQSGLFLGIVRLHDLL